VLSVAAIAWALSTSAMAAEPAPPADAPTVAPKRSNGAFVGDEWRYHRTGLLGWLKGVLTRPFIDLASIPTTLITWDAWDWTAAALVVGVSAGMAVPVKGRSLDARLQDEIHVWHGPNCDYARDATFCATPVKGTFHVWRGGNADAAIIAIATGIPLTALLIGALGDQPPLVEAGALAIEAFLVSEAYHISTKLLLGREAPLADNGAGAFHGPSIKYWPDGWPSGHAATLFSIATVYAEYFDTPWLSVLLLGVAGALSVMLVLDDAHFAGEVLIGAGLGYFTGRWVVRHRSTHYTSESDGAPVRLVSVTPLPLGPGAYGLGARFAF